MRAVSAGPQPVSPSQVSISVILLLFEQLPTILCHDLGIPLPGYGTLWREVWPHSQDHIDILSHEANRHNLTNSSVTNEEICPQGLTVSG